MKRKLLNMSKGTLAVRCAALVGSVALGVAALSGVAAIGAGSSSLAGASPTTVVSTTATTFPFVPTSEVCDVFGGTVTCYPISTSTVPTTLVPLTSEPSTTVGPTTTAFNICNYIPFFLRWLFDILLHCKV
jgi:peptidoglycan biosynthesis protein MviN/MurJ (putative lipid II flippase)